MIKHNHINLHDRDRVLGADAILAEVKQFRRLSKLGLSDSDIAHRMASTEDEVKKVRKLLLGANTSLMELKLRYQTRLLLGSQGLRTINDLLAKRDKELLAIRGLGPKTLQSLKEALCIFMGAEL